MSKLEQDLDRIAGRVKKTMTPMFTKYVLRGGLNTIIFLVTVYLYFFRKDLLTGFVAPGFFSQIGLREIVWIVLVLDMMTHLIPMMKLTMGFRKSHAETYVGPTDGFEIADLYQYVQTMNIKAWTVMLVWLLVNAFIALVYVLNVIGEAEMLLVTGFYIISESICILFYCPFQSLIMKNRCCVNCRIFDWGHFMMYTPMLFIKSFFSWSLFFLSCVVLIKWEISYAAHPWRFWNGSNAAIRCENCHDKLCHIKRPLRDIYRNIRIKVNLPLPEYDEEFFN